MSEIAGLLSFFVFVLAAVTIGLFTNLLSDEAANYFEVWSRRLIGIAVNRLPANARERYREEWLAHLDECPGKMTKLITAIQLMLVAGRLRLPEIGQEFEIAPHALPDVSHRPSRTICPELTQRELDVLRWAAEGKTAWEIGQILGIAARSVRNHGDQLKRKYKVPTMIQVAVLAILDGQLKVSDWSRGAAPAPELTKRDEQS